MPVMNIDEYTPVELTEEIQIEQLVTVHFFQLQKGYNYSGERHDFWELVYVDKGRTEVGADGQRITLNENDVIFHKPGEFHSVWADLGTSIDIVIFSFVCNSPVMQIFENRCLHANDDEKYLIAQIVLEMRNAFSNDLNRGYIALKRLDNGLFGAEQIVKATLETLLIKFIRDIRRQTGEQYRNRGDYILYSANTPRKEQHEHIILGIQNYIMNNMHKKLSIDTICREFNMCRSSVNRLFRRRFNMSFNEYLNTKRHECAKRYLREGQYTMNEIAVKCGYGSASYFSNKFRSTENMNPSEYARSVRMYTSCNLGS